jgi:4-amino-4-deoxy-L-arabinose transferase-like glycosyltransferase
MSVAEAKYAAAPALDSASRISVRWERVGLAILLAATAATFIWGLDRNGWANPYYSAAAQAGSQDWKAFFYGSLDGGNLITVDKPPLSIWIMSLSVRLFGLNSWALLVPQALMGIATTWLIYKIIRRSHSAAPALLGGLIYATTPVVVLMSRYNNPEPLMGLLTVAAVYFVLRAIEDNRWAWYLLAGTSLGFGFMAKQIQAFLPIPALVLAVLLFGLGSVLSRLLRLLAALVALIISGGWWMIVVELTPAANRPYIGGSTTNSLLELTLDYNGLARFIQIPTKISGGRSVSNDELAPYNGGFSRIFDGNFAPEIAWVLFPAIALVIILVVLNGALNYSMLQRNLVVVAVAWFGTAFFLLCFMGSMIHTYYTYSLAAPMALVLPIGLWSLWCKRERVVLRLIGSLVIGAATYMCLRVLDYSDAWPLWFRVLIVVVGISAAGGWLWLRTANGSRLMAGAVALILVIGPLGADSYTLATPQSGTNPQSGPVANDSMAMSRLLLMAKEGRPAWARQIAFGSTPVSTVSDLLRSTKNDQMWAAATYSAQNAALYQLESGRPVVALGGWLGTDPAPTLEQFQSMVAQKHIGYFIWQQDLLERGELNAEIKGITDWVHSNFKEQVVDGVRLYDLRG